MVAGFSISSLSLCITLVFIIIRMHSQIQIYTPHGQDTNQRLVALCIIIISGIESGKVKHVCADNGELVDCLQCSQHTNIEGEQGIKERTKVG